ncbi:ABC transporter ATP-binding protein [Peribacillus cavernae]|uniref:ABC transporter ATP-binding protein n=1 Tax=Peribacillus cavernae TaxID=1674310 RepID=A0A433HJQ3_9BACI|nr:ABC transporter ATP-binding protein [Peribacillus cavernae]MDQ0219151.1 branched-chain amino acid transport system ATP-binding protein [Peribacillus cavernae]RUQ28620.1 ABC transporter ATP-binding protein [Peribacillus cavernae]
MLKLQNVNLFYGEIQALWDLSFEIKEGQIAALLGANAAGKSSAINAISGIEKISSGEITLFDKEIHKMSPHEIVEEGIIQVPEGRKLFNYMPIQENLELGAYSKRAKKDFKKNLRFVYDLFPILEERKSQMAGDLSGGQQQMVAIARGLMANPKLLIIDELSLGLAPILVQQLIKDLINIRNTGITILLVEQNVQQSLAIASDAYVLENGRLALSGNATELINDPHLKKAYLGM